MAPETLTLVERLQIVQQLEILEALCPDEAQHYASKREIIQQGLSLEYGTVFQELYEEMSVEECRYVMEVLDMHRVLITSFDALEDKAGLTADDVKFKGFDGNNETKRLLYAKYLKEQGRWEEALAGYLNSHSVMTTFRYPSMLEKYRPIHDALLNSFGDWNLSAEQIKSIIS